MFGREFFDELRIRVRHNWRLIVAILAPILLLPVAFASGDPNYHVSPDDPKTKFRCAYVIMVMAVYWVLEVMPLAITSLLPLVLFPLMDIQDASTVSQNYMKESNMIFLASIVLALAIEYCGLHVRGALKVISIFGTNPIHIMLGIMIVAGSLSMWISDTSCTTMLLPILTALTTAMFQEEQEDVTTIAHLDDENDGQDNELHAGPVIRSRRQSSVFANSAMQGQFYSGATRRRSSAARRRSTIKRSESFRSHIQTSPLNSPSSPTTPNFPPVDTVSNSGSATDGMAGSEDKTGERAKIVNFASRTENAMSVVVEDAAPESNNEQSNNKSIQLQRPVKTEKDERMQENIRKMLLFAVAYSASIGGSGSLVGTGPVKVFKQLIKDDIGKNYDIVAITFATWMSFNIPTLTVNIAIAWLFLALRYMGFNFLFKRHKKNSRLEKEKVRTYLQEEYRKLGPISSHEISVCAIFIFVVLLWIFRDPQFFPGWNAIVGKKTSGDSTPGMLGVLLLFVLPRNWSFLKWGKKKYIPEGKYQALLDWKFVSTNAPWGYVLLIGSGYAIADACKASFLSHYIAHELDYLSSVPPATLLLIVMCITSLLTEVVSNTACASLILPILFSVSCDLNIHPIYLTMASAVTASYAFMLPISSPPNGIIFSTGELEIREMVTNGLFIGIVCNLVLYIFVVTYGELIFEFSEYNKTCTLNLTLV